MLMQVLFAEVLTHFVATRGFKNNLGEVMLLIVPNPEADILF